jgi:hypothetical protein
VPFMSRRSYFSSKRQNRDRAGRPCRRFRSCFSGLMTGFRSDLSTTLPQDAVRNDAPSCPCHAIQSLPFTVGLLFSLLNFARPYPHWLYNWLWISFGVLFVGQIRAWWIPYVFEWSRSGPIVIGSYSATRTPSCRCTTELSRTRRMCCFIYRLPLH